MAHKSIRGFLKHVARASIVAGFVLGLAVYGFCEVKFDGSSVARGKTDSLPGPDYTIEAGMGTQTGTNLFHSFSKFNIGTGEQATFTGTGATGPIGNIIGRITGGSMSSIDGGIVSTIPGANLFLMNPYGFMFGPNAWINVPGSFHVTTADYLRMSDGAKFYADLGKTSVLSTEPVAAFGFLSSNPGSISVTGSYLSGPPSTMISMVGGNIEIKDDVAWPAWIEVPNGQINLVSVASPGEVVINQPGFPPSVDVSSFAALGGITLQRTTDAGYVNVMVDGTYDGSFGAGTIIVRGGRLQMTTSFLNANNYGPAPSNPVAIDVAITGDILMQQDSQILAQNSGPAPSGSILVQAGNLQMQEAAMIATAAIGPGDAGNVMVNVANNLSLLPLSEISSNTVDVGKGGDISITAKNITVAADQWTIDNNAFTGIAAQTFGAGTGGSLTIRTDSLRVLDAGAISTNLTPLPAPYGPTTASGTGGKVDIQAKDILVSGMIIKNDDGVDYHSRIESRLMTEYATGTGGDVSVKADRITLGDGGYIGTYLTYGSPGTAGNITVESPTITLNPRGKIESSSVLGTGNNAKAGNISLLADNITMAGTSKMSDARTNFTGVRSDTSDGTGGAITISSNSLSVSSGAQIMSDSSGSGKGGNITINSGLVRLNGQALVSAQSSAGGDAGNITFNVGSLEIESAMVSTNARFTDGGNITVKAPDTVYLLDSKMTASVGGGASTVGGNIFIDPQYVILNDSSITANAFEGRGGNIRIIAGVFLASVDSVVSASSQLGIDGTVDVRSPVTNVSGTLAPVRGAYLQNADLVRDRCFARIQGATQSSLTMSGRDGLPPRPGNVLPALPF